MLLACSSERGIQSALTHTTRLWKSRLCRKVFQYAIIADAMLLAELQVKATVSHASRAGCHHLTP